MSTVVAYILLFLLIPFILPFSTQEEEQKKFSNISISKPMNIEVTTVSKYSEKWCDAPGKVYVISNQQIHECEHLDLSDVLKYIPGIDIVDNAQGFGEYHTIRDIEGNDRFQVLISGRKLNPDSGKFISIGNSIFVRFAKQIEILIRPISAIYGTGAFSGIINIIFKGSAMNQREIYTTYDYNNSYDFGAYINHNFFSDLVINLSSRFFKSDEIIYWKKRK